MTKQGKIDSIKSYFVISEDIMPKISASNLLPNYTFLQQFQDVINENTMTVPATNIDLGHASLTMKRSNFTTGNGGIYASLISLGDIPRNPAFTGGVTT